MSVFQGTTVHAGSGVAAPYADTVRFVASGALWFGETVAQTTASPFYGATVNSAPANGPWYGPSVGKR